MSEDKKYRVMLKGVSPMVAIELTNKLSKSCTSISSTKKRNRCNVILSFDDMTFAHDTSGWLRKKGFKPKVIAN